MLQLMLVPILITAMPDKWMGRTHTIDNYQEDGSALGRINAWKFAVNVANHFPLGGGFLTLRPDLPFNAVLPSWRTGSPIIRKCGTNPEYACAVTTAEMARSALSAS